MEGRLLVFTVYLIIQMNVQFGLSPLFRLHEWLSQPEPSELWLLLESQRDLMLRVHLVQFQNLHQGSGMCGRRFPQTAPGLTQGR